MRLNRENFFKKNCKFVILSKRRKDQKKAAGYWRKGGGISLKPV